jgi:hypothetical protein
MQLLGLIAKLSKRADLIPGMLKSWESLQWDLEDSPQPITERECVS